MSNMRRWVCLAGMLLFTVAVYAQQLSLSGRIEMNGTIVDGAIVKLTPGGLSTTTDEKGNFSFPGVAPGNYELTIQRVGAEEYKQKVTVRSENVILTLRLTPAKSTQLDDIVVYSANEHGAGKLRQVEGTAIYAGKKTEVVNIANINANLATNNPRQVYGRIVGLNIWEYDGGGVQLGIGGRGLNPSRVSNFNTRQNGYDISADALGYPESYYTPPTEAIERIEVVRGAASLQYGTQFGGLVNFQLKKGPADKPFEFISRQTGGSFGFFNSFNSIGGTTHKLNYYSYFQYKRADSWRANSHFNQQTAYIHVDYPITDKLKITGEYTFMHYLAQQPGGLTDSDFDKDPSMSVRSRNWFKVDWNLYNITFDYQINSSTKLNWRSYALRAGREALGILSYINRPDPGGPRDLLADTYRNYGSELRLLHQYRLFNGQTSSLLTGVRVYKGLTYRDQGDADAGSGAVFNFDPKEPNLSSYKFPGTNIAAFAENIFQITDKWSITPGVRFEHISTKADGYYYKIMRFVPNVKMPEQKENNRSFVLFGIGTSYQFKSGIELYANISQNYRSINFNDLRVQNDNAKVDSLLKDETGFTADGGVRGKLNDWLYFDASIFLLRYNDRIGSIFTKDQDNMVYRLRTNVADSRNIGFESLIEADLLKLLSAGVSRHRLSVYTNFALIDSRYINTQETAIKDKLVEYVPPVLFRTGLSFGNKKYNITYQYSYVARQYSDATNAEFTPTAVDGVVPAYQVMDMSFSYQWRWLGIFASINNLANAKYFTRRADGYPGPGIIPSDRRGYYLTLQVKI
ncbi:TonB-dependent receptor plug domain-containing protein [Chitinophaga sp. ysch24]|uniref:TonB-dependent receptor plug domain-containing protein n=2 Tax=Chitinophaga tropicalis TaxID=2683588 RepID=A0A7K1U576_9BACT|nr:TonB-dependent receptor plug domain-containing protein [Chitinophaga tropicalis]